MDISGILAIVFISAEHVAVLTAGALFFASMPQIPGDSAGKFTFDKLVQVKKRVEQGINFLCEISRLA